MPPAAETTAGGRITKALFRGGTQYHFGGKKKRGENAQEEVQEGTGNHRYPKEEQFVYWKWNEQTKGVPPQKNSQLQKGGGGGALGRRPVVLGVTKVNYCGSRNKKYKKGVKIRSCAGRGRTPIATYAAQRGGGKGSYSGG